MKLFFVFMLCLLAVPLLLCYVALRLQRRIERLIAARVEAELEVRLAPAPTPANHKIADRSPLPSPDHANPAEVCFSPTALERQARRRILDELRGTCGDSPAPSNDSPTPVPAPLPDHVSHTDSSTFYARPTHEVSLDQVVLTVNYWCLREGNRLRTVTDLGHREATVAQILPNLEQHFQCRGALK